MTDADKRRCGENANNLPPERQPNNGHFREQSHSHSQSFECVVHVFFLNDVVQQQTQDFLLD